MQLLLFALKIRVPVLVIGIIIISALFIYAIISIIKEKGKGNPELEELERNAEKELEITEAHGVICKMECGDKAGGRVSSSAMQFYIEFRDDDGNESGYFISKEAYLELDTDIPGTLATLDGRFYGFCYDESEEGAEEAEAEVSDADGSEEA